MLSILVSTRLNYNNETDFRGSHNQASVSYTQTPVPYPTLSYSLRLKLWLH